MEQLFGFDDTVLQSGILHLPRVLMHIGKESVVD